MFRKFFALAFMVATLFLGDTAQAGVITDRLPFLCYVDHQVYTYNQPNGQRIGYISPNVDLVRVTQVRGDGWVYGDYPGSGGKRVARWFKITDLCADPGYSNRGTKIQGAQRVFRTKNSGDTIGSVSNNESVIVLADNGNRAQILYRLDNNTGYKVGWVPSSTVSARSSGSTSNLKGDVNGDGRVDNSDVELMRKYMVGTVSESQINKSNADMNGNGRIDVADLAMLIDETNNSQPTNTNHNPQGSVQVAESPSTGVLHVRGTAFDQDNPNGSTRIHVYVGGGAGSGAQSYEIRTNGSNRIFDDTRQVNRTGNQPVYVYALNDYGGGNNAEIWHGNVNIQGSSPNGDYNAKIQQFINHDWYKDNSQWGWDCAAYANEFTNFVFGKDRTAGRLFKNANEIQAGDVVYLVGSPNHFFVVLAKNGNKLITIEGNYSKVKDRRNPKNNKYYGKTVYSETAYTIEGGRVLRNGKESKRFSYGHHFL